MSPWGKVCLQISKSLPALIVFEFPLIGTSQGQTAGEWQSWGAPSPRLSAQGSSSCFPGSLGSNGLVLQDFLPSRCRGQRVHNELKSLSQLSPKEERVQSRQKRSRCCATGTGLFPALDPGQGSHHCPQRSQFREDGVRKGLMEGS